MEAPKTRNHSSKKAVDVPTLSAVLSIDPRFSEAVLKWGTHFAMDLLKGPKQNYFTLRTLLVAGLPADSRGSNGQTILMEASRMGDKDIVEMLLKMGADKTLTDYFNHRAADYAESGNHPELMDLLRVDEQKPQQPAERA